MSLQVVESHSSGTRECVLLVEDRADDLALALELLDGIVEAGQVATASRASDWRRELEERAPRVVICAAELSWAEGVSVLRASKRRIPGCQTLLLGAASADEVADCMELGEVDAVLAKSSRGWSALATTVRECLAAGSRAPERTAETNVSMAAATPPPWRQSPRALVHDMQELVQLITHSARFLVGRDSVRAEPNAAQDAQRVVTNAERLQSMLDDVLAGRTAPSGNRILLDEVVGEIVERVYERKDTRCVAIDYAGLPVVYGDPGAIYRLFDNLILNSVKHASQQRLQIRIRARRNDGGCLISVADDGPGIPDGDEERVFAPHVRGEHVEQPPGQGLGLTTCRDIVEAHGGTIWLDSPPAGGVVVYIDFPSSMLESAS